MAQGSWKNTSTLPSIGDTGEQDKQTSCPLRPHPPLCANPVNVALCSALLQHQPLRDRDVHDHLPDAAQCGYAYFHLTKTQSVEEPQVALPLKELAFAGLEPIIQFFVILHSICLINCVCLLYETVGLGFRG